MRVGLKTYTFNDLSRISKRIKTGPYILQQSPKVLNN